MFCTSQAGANASANLYSLIESAKLKQLNPHSYLQQIFQTLSQAETLEEIEALLPWNSQFR
ncbi:transposase domain-containing protein [Marinomonas agarivorans]|nr:transposase domain-containing protein [Marinomonas agarivorans]